MQIDEDTKKQIAATKPASFTIKTLRPIANLLATYTSPSQINSLVEEFGFEEVAKTPDEASAALLRIFEALREENNDEDIKKILEASLSLYAQLIDEKLHEVGLIGPVREILRRGHFHLGFQTREKKYLVLPFEGPLHGAIMRAEGRTEEDFQDPKKRPIRKSKKSKGGISRLFEFSLSKNGVLARINPINDDRPYSMSEGSRRHEVMKALVTSSEKGIFCPTEVLAEMAGCTATEFRKTCGELRKQIGKHFSGIRRIELIEAKRRSGYRINLNASVVEIP